MMTSLMANFYYVAAIILFLIGLYIMLTHANLIKKVIGMNIIDTSIFLFFIAAGYIEGARSPIVDPLKEGVMYVNPLPSGLMLTGIVVSVSITAFALSLIIRVYSFYGTINIEEIMEIRSGMK